MVGQIGLARQVTCPRARALGVWLVKADENVHVCREVCRLDDERPPGNRQTSLHELHALVKARSNRDEFECNVMNAVR